MAGCWEFFWSIYSEWSEVSSGERVLSKRVCPCSATRAGSIESSANSTIRIRTNKKTSFGDLLSR